MLGTKGSSTGKKEEKERREREKRERDRESDTKPRKKQFPNILSNRG